MSEERTGGYCSGCLEPLSKCTCLEEELADALKQVKIIRPKEKENE